MVDTINNTQAAKPAESAVAAEDIVSKVSKHIASEPSKAVAKESVDVNANIETKVNTAFISPEEMSRIKDPFARQLIETKQKEMLSGMNKKFQEAAELKKSLEEQIQQLSQSKPKYDISTKEGLKMALNDPEFSTLVKEVAQEAAPDDFLKQGGNQEEWSVLTDSERSQFKYMREEIDQLKNDKVAHTLQNIDSRLRERHSDYDPTAINQLSKDLNANKIGTEELREMMFKALNYEKAIQRAAEITREELNGNITQKVNASSFDSVSNPNVTDGSVLVKEENEKPANYFSRIAKSRLANLTNN